MGMRLVGRNISYDVFALSNECPPHIPRYPPLSEKKSVNTKYPSQQVFGIVLTYNRFSLYQVFGMVVR